MVNGDDETLPPRAAALARLAAALTSEPWALRRETLDEVIRHGLDEKQIEAAVAVIALFNYLTRVADATGIEFDYVTSLPPFQPNRGQVPASRPAHVAAAQTGATTRPLHYHDGLRAAWEAWRTYLLETGRPLTRRERRLLAAVAAEECGDGAGARALAEGEPLDIREHRLVEFARQLSLQPWRMQASDLDRLREAGLSEPAVLHVISVVAHQNAESRLVAGLRTAGRS